MSLITETLKNKNASGIELMLSLSQAFDPPTLVQEHPTLLRADIARQFKVTLDTFQSDRLQAACVAAGCKLFEESWEVFRMCVDSLAGVPCDFETFEPTEAEHMAAGLAEAHLLRNEFAPDEPSFMFDDEVRAYVGRVCHEYGLSKAPSIFPNALMPGGEGVEDANYPEKDEALMEIFNHRTEYLTERIKEIKTKL